MPEQSTVRIAGKGGQIHVFDAETGREFPATEVDFHVDMDNYPTATIKMFIHEFDVVTGATILSRCPECGREAGTRQSTSFDVDDPVRVRLTEFGRDIHREYRGNDPGADVDGDGRIVLPLWEAMVIFGKFMALGSYPPLGTTIQFGPFPPGK